MTLENIMIKKETRRSILDVENFQKSSIYFHIVAAAEIFNNHIRKQRQGSRIARVSVVAAQSIGSHLYTQLK